jgi:hypothetical protein
MTIKNFTLYFSIAVISTTTVMAVVDKDFRGDYAGIVQTTLPVLVSSTASKNSKDSEDSKTSKK